MSSWDIRSPCQVDFPRGQTCKYQIKDYTLTNTDKRVSNILQGITTATLDNPVPLTRWGSFPLPGVGFGMSEASYRHAVTPVVDGALPVGIVFDDKAWAVKVATNALWFYVIVGFHNQGTEVVCMEAPEIGSVENSANLPVYTDIWNTTAAPAETVWTTDTVCLRPGEAGWTFASVSVAAGDSAAFTNAAFAKLAAAARTGPFSEAVAPTPYKFRYTPGGGVHVEVIDPASAIRLVYLDDQGLPVGPDESSDSLPATQSGLVHLVYTFSFAEPDVLGTATTVLVYTAE